MEVIAWYYLLAAGIILIGIEALFFSFFLIWIGVGCLAVSVLTYFGFFESGIAQISTAFAIGLILVFALRKWSMNMLNKTQDDTEEKAHQGGIGTIDKGMIKMGGTFWQSDDDLSAYKDGDKVEVVDIVNNKAVLK
ncbi:NfeD family protein [Sulfurimonas sp. MAG313]|nr:NfeD family protein [Sulfurimonas sp. MAG313]MDF1881378.1 NfeD family protein [Sulfurimonas sp. MAG313]